MPLTHEQRRRLTREAISYLGVVVVGIMLSVTHSPWWIVPTLVFLGRQLYLVSQLVTGRPRGGSR